MPRIVNWLEVEKRIAELKKDLGVSAKKLTEQAFKANDSINLMLNALQINLGDLLDSQSEISLWFYDIDIPTESTEPYKSWTTPADHEGDIFYSRTKGTIYKYTSSGWKKLNDINLLNAMALTNSKLEADDNERKVFTAEPSPPYESGDWYIHDDGTLYICQIGRDTGIYQENDFIQSIAYANAIAKATDNQLEVLRGTIIKVSDSSVKYIDKETNTTTDISGNSIKSGMITSNNYVANNTGMQINLIKGKIDTKNFKLDEYGNVNLLNGATIISEKGLLTNLQFSDINYNANKLVSAYPQLWGTFEPIFITCNIPKKFNIISAKINIQMRPVFWSNKNVYGYQTHFAIYKANFDSKVAGEYGGEDQLDLYYMEKVPNAFESSTYWDITIPSDRNYKMQQKETADLSKYIIDRSATFKVVSCEDYTLTDDTKSYLRTCIITATLNIIGYYNF